MDGCCIVIQHGKKIHYLEYMNEFILFDSPIDGQLVWNVGIENEQRASSSRPIRSKSASQNPIKPIVHPSKLSLLSADMGLTITPYRIRTPQPFPSPEINTRPSTGDIRRLKLVLNRNRSLSYESSHSTMK